MNFLLTKLRKSIGLFSHFKELCSILFLGICLGIYHCLAGLLLVIILIGIRDVIYRIFYIRPIVQFNGSFAHNIEDSALYRWVFSGIETKQDIVFIGNSHIMDAINGELLYDKMGIRSFNFCFYSAQLPNILEFFALQQVTPKAICINIAPRYIHYEDAHATMLKNYSESYNYLKKNHLLTCMYSIADLLANIVPSLFVPLKYQDFLLNGLRSIGDSKRKGFLQIGRYVPFKRLISYRWGIHKKYNYRFVDRNMCRSAEEVASQASFLKKSIGELPMKCNVGSDRYMKGVSVLTKTIISLSEKIEKIYIIRLPQHSSMIEAENRLCSDVFLNITELAATCPQVEYLDMTNLIDDNHFYIDGQHVDYELAYQVTLALGHVLTKS